MQAATLLPELTDGEVLDALRKLADQIRSSGWPHFREQPPGTDDLIAWLIVHEWEDIFRRRGRLSRRDMVGCLNTVIESTGTHVRKPGGYSYLKYLKKFMKRAGVSIDMVPAEEFEDELEDKFEFEDDELFYDLDRMSLAELGALFLKEPDVIGVDDAFENRAHARITAGRAGEVIALCQRLLGQTDEPYICAILHTLLGMAYRHKGDLEQAVAMFQAAQSPRLTYTDALDRLAETYREMGEYEQAVKTWRECLADPRSDVYFYRQPATSTRGGLPKPIAKRAIWLARRRLCATW